MGVVEEVVIPVRLRFVTDSEPLAKTAADIDFSQVEYGSLVKAVDESRYSLGLAYPALRPDRKKGVDGKRDFVRPEVLEQAAWSWMSKSASAGLYHFNGAGGGAPVDGCCQVVESYIYRGPDWMLKSADGSEVTIYPGDWLIGALWDDESWPMVKSLQVGGWSPEGSAGRRKATPHDLADLRAR
jgi:hypothetical protein